MLRFGLPGAASGPLRVLALGCHADDIELGCAGALLQLKHRAPSLEVRWVIFSASGERAREARASAEDLLEGIARAEVVLHEFRDGYLPYLGAAGEGQRRGDEGLRARRRLHPPARRPPPGSPAD